MAAIYTVKWAKQIEGYNADGTQLLCDPVWNLLHDVRTDRVILEPELDMRAAEAGSFSFGVTVEHPDYAELQEHGVLTVFAVFRNDTFLWAGHPITFETDLYGTLRITCEGILGYLSDTVLDTFSYDYVHDNTGNVILEASGRTIDSYFRDIFIGGHNDRIGLYSPDYMGKSFWRFPTMLRLRGFNPRTDGFGSATYVRKTGKNITAMEAIRTRLIDYFGGWLEVRIREGEGVFFWDLIYHASYTSVSPKTAVLKLGENIISLRREWDYSDFCTALCPVDSSGNAILSGANVLHYPSGDTVIDVVEVNSPYSLWEPDSLDADGNYAYWWSPSWEAVYPDVFKGKQLAVIVNRRLVKQYGLIAKSYTEDSFDFDFDADDSYYKAREALFATIKAVQELEEPSEFWDVRAVDMSVLDGELDPILPGKIVSVDIGNGNIQSFPVNGVSLRLDDPSKNTITLNGTIKTLSGML